MSTKKLVWCVFLLACGEPDRSVGDYGRFPGGAPRVSCCAICTPPAGPCGDACVSMPQACTKPSGCACWGDYVEPRPNVTYVTFPSPFASNPQSPAAAPQQTPMSGSMAARAAGSPAPDSAGSPSTPMAAPYDAGRDASDSDDAGVAPRADPPRAPALVPAPIDVPPETPGLTYAERNREAIYYAALQLYTCDVESRTVIPHGSLEEIVAGTTYRLNYSSSRSMARERWEAHYLACAHLTSCEWVRCLPAE